MPALVRGAFAAYLAVFVTSVAAADGPQRPWRPVTPQEISRIVATREAAARAPVPRAIAVAPAQRAYIDPVTNELVSSPVVPPEPEDDLQAARSQQSHMQLERNAKGFYKIDTSDYQMRATARIGADGNVELDCLDPAHGHATEPQR